MNTSKIPTKIHSFSRPLQFFLGYFVGIVIYFLSAISISYLLNNLAFQQAIGKLGLSENVSLAIAIIALILIIFLIIFLFLLSTEKKTWLTMVGGLLGWITFPLVQGVIGITDSTLSR